MSREDSVFVWALVFVLSLPLAMVVGGLVFGFVAAPTPPDSEEPAGDAVLRVVSPEGEPYGIIWNYELEEAGETPVGSSYNDYEVPPAGGSFEEGFNIALYRIENEDGGKWEGPFYAILFVGGEYATCTVTEVPVLRLYWGSEKEPGNPLLRATCGRYRYAAPA